MSSQRLYCVDAPIWFFRALFSWPDRWHTEDGLGLNGLMGYASVLRDILLSENPDWIMVAFDESLGSGWRHRLDAHYKSNRLPPDDNIAFQLNACKALSQALGIAVYADQEYEADDFIASAAQLGRAGGLPTTVITRDKDLAQVLRASDDEWWDFGKKRRLTKAEWELQAGINTEQQADYLALVGDASDAIIGVPGIGPATAVTLLNRYQDISGIIAAAGQGIETLRNRRAVSSALLENRQQLQLARRLTGLAKTTKPNELGDMHLPLPDWQAAAGTLCDLGVPAQWVERWQVGSGAP